MKKNINKVATLFLCALLIGKSAVVVHADTGYTYNYDWWGDVQYSPDAYKTVDVFTGVDLSLEQNLNAPQGLFVQEDKIYVCDTGNNRILELQREDQDSIKLLRIIDGFQGEVEVKTFNKPTDVVVSKDGYIYIADNENSRILKLDKDLNYCMEFTKPLDATFDQSLTFLPNKITLDAEGRVYCVATNVNKGLIKYEKDGTFSGFIGATPVTYDWTDYIWKRLATKAQRAQLASFVPTEYDNLFMDYEGFIYVCTTNVSESDLNSGAADPMRRLNMMGKDILVRNGNWEIIGDIYWGAGGGYEGPSLITDITAMENDVFVGLDKVRGRLFAYDDQGKMLYAFGGNGNMDGYFKQPTAIDHMGQDLLVLDALDNSITLFTPTDYGKTIYDAIEQFQNGKYEESGTSWKKVMDLNGNYDLAYIGIGRSLMRQEKYHEAMKYFELKLDDDNYSKAFKQYRKEWVEEHIVIIFLAVFLVLGLPLAIGKVRNIKHEIDTADIFKTD